MAFNWSWDTERGNGSRAYPPVCAVARQDPCWVLRGQDPVGNPASDQDPDRNGDADGMRLPHVLETMSRPGLQTRARQALVTRLPPTVRPGGDARADRASAWLAHQPAHDGVAREEEHDRERESGRDRARLQGPEAACHKQCDRHEPFEDAPEHTL